MSRADQIEFARRIALRLLDARQRSLAELREKLVARNVPGDVIEELLARFIEVGLLDDKAYAESITATRTSVDLRGRVRIRQELRRRGIDDEVAAEALEAVDSEDELAAALMAAERKARSLRGLDVTVARRRLYGMLARRGFSGSVVRQAVDETIGERGAWGADDDLG